jgi:addiction module RelE/StbE family toxin
MKIKVTPKFQRKLKKLKGQVVYLKKLKNTIHLIEENYQNPILDTHKLSGNLKDYYASSCGYDCRILFKITIIDDEKVIILADFGKHDEVY